MRAPLALLAGVQVSLQLFVGRELGVLVVIQVWGVIVRCCAEQKVAFLSWSETQPLGGAVGVEVSGELGLGRLGEFHQGVGAAGVRVGGQRVREEAHVLALVQNPSAHDSCRWGALVGRLAAASRGPWAAARPTAQRVPSVGLRALTSTSSSSAAAAASAVAHLHAACPHPNHHCHSLVRTASLSSSGAAPVSPHAVPAVSVIRLGRDVIALDVTSVGARVTVTARTGGQPRVSEGRGDDPGSEWAVGGGGGGWGRGLAGGLGGARAAVVVVAVVVVVVVVVMPLVLHRRGVGAVAAAEGPSQAPSSVPTPSPASATPPAAMATAGSKSGGSGVGGGGDGGGRAASGVVRVDVDALGAGFAEGHDGHVEVLAGAFLAAPLGFVLCALAPRLPARLLPSFAASGPSSSSSHVAARLVAGASVLVLTLSLAAAATAATATAVVLVLVVVHVGVGQVGLRRAVVVVASESRRAATYSSSTSSSTSSRGAVGGAALVLLLLLLLLLVLVHDDVAVPALPGARVAFGVLHGAARQQLVVGVGALVVRDVAVLRVALLVVAAVAHLVGRGRVA